MLVIIKKKILSLTCLFIQSAALKSCRSYQQPPSGNYSLAGFASMFIDPQDLYDHVSDPHK